MRRLAMFAVLLLLVPWSASAISPEKEPGRDLYTMCSAEDGDGVVCDNADSADIVLDTGQFASIALDFSRSTATTFDCDLRANDTGDTTDNFEVLNSVAFSTSQYSITFEDTPLYVWVYCTTTTGGTVTATALARRNK